MIEDNKVYFQVEIKDFKATELITRHRFKEKLRLRCEFDDKKFKTKKQLVGGGDVTWKFHINFDYILTLEHTSQFILDFARRELLQKTFKIIANCQHDEKEKKEPLGSLSVDLYTLATGPVEHYLPLMDSKQKVIGRLSFFLEMAEVSNVMVIFKTVKVSNLPSMEEGFQGVNPYLKYSYSRLWPAVVEGKQKAVYSETKYHDSNPEWEDLPPLIFKAPLQELVHESIVLHVTHRGKTFNTTIGRINLLFRTLVDNGRVFKVEDLIAFKGPLKVGNAEIEGRLYFKTLPHFAPMKPINSIRKAIHTEKGILDAMPLLPWLPKPSVPIIISEEKETIIPSSPKNVDSIRRRANSLEKIPSMTNLSKNLFNGKGKDDIKSEEKIKLEEKEKSELKKENSINEKTLIAKQTSVDLIDLSTPPQVRRARSVSHTPAPIFNGNPNFVSPQLISNPFVSVTTLGQNFNPSQNNPTNPFLIPTTMNQQQQQQFQQNNNPFI